MLWRALAGGTTRESLTAALWQEYGIDADAREADTDAFLAALSERGLLEG